MTHRGISIMKALPLLLMTFALAVTPVWLARTAVN